MAEKNEAQFKVTGPVAIEGVAPGETVTLDPTKTNVAALVEAGHVEPLNDAAKKAAEVRDGTKAAEDETRVPAAERKTAKRERSGANDADENKSE
jgi:hypothetical protein